MILENNFRYSTNTDNIPIKDVFKMLKELYTMLTTYSRKRKNYKQCGDITIKRYIPLLNLIIVYDNVIEHKIEYEKQLKFAHKIAARISLEHYFIYREWEEKEKDKFFAPRYEILEGYIHYQQELEFNPKFETLIFNAPSGYGKSYPEKITEAWSYGIDDEGCTLSLCSNEDVVKGGSRTVIDEIKSNHFGEVFPHLTFDPKDNNFFLKETENNWKLRNCRLQSSYIAKTTQSNVVGTRASKRIHIDDLYPDYKEAMNHTLNEYYLNKFLTVWIKRFVQNKTPKCVITGTLWASGDFIALIISLMRKKHKFYPHPKYKYTFVNEAGTVAIVQVPALDYKTEESTCPELKTTEQVLEEKENIEEYLFETNFQQIPTDPESLGFSYGKLRTYNTIPSQEVPYCQAVIDATRKSGKDFFAMPIFSKINNDGMYDYYLKDCLFTRTATKDMYDKIIDKIIDNHIVFIVIESNVTSELKSNIEGKLKAKGIHWCIIHEKYNTVPKPTRIELEKGIIKRQMVFPGKGMYGVNTEMGKFMGNLTLYNSTGRNSNDDAPDSCALFGSEIIEENSKPQKAIPLSFARECI